MWFHSWSLECAITSGLLIVNGVMCYCTILEILVTGVYDSIMPSIRWVEVEVGVLNSNVLSSDHWERKQFEFSILISP